MIKDSNKKEVTIFLVAGELSGDIHGANLIKSFQKMYDKINLYGTGGNYLLALGQKQSYTIDDMSIIGFIAALKSIFKIMKMLKRVRIEIEKIKPDIVILIDYPGFNLRLAKAIKPIAKKIVYYIAPQFWVWDYKRIYALRDYTDLTLSIYPHEMNDLLNAKVNAKYVGNPIIDNFNYNYDSKDSFMTQLRLDRKKEIIGILPGSRKHELKNLLPKYMQVVELMKDRYQFVISQSESIDDNFIRSIIHDSDIKILKKSQYDIMKFSDALIVCSGTVTLESALHLTPAVITYQMSTLNMFIAKRVSKLRMIGLPNIILGKLLLKEIHGSDIQVADIVDALLETIANKDSIVQELKKLKVEFSVTSPSDKAAKEIYSLDNIG